MFLLGKTKKNEEGVGFTVPIDSVLSEMKESIMIKVKKCIQSQVSSAMLHTMWTWTWEFVTVLLVEMVLLASTNTLYGKHY